MYVWSIEKLKQQLIAAPLTERQVLPYLLVYMFASMAPLPFAQPPADTWDFFEMGLSGLMGLAGTVYAYRCNGGDAGRHFLQRYLTVSWVVSVRWGAVMVPLLVAAWFTPGVAEGEMPTLWWAGWMLSYAILIWRVAHHLRVVAHAERQQISVQVEADR